MVLALCDRFHALPEPGGILDQDVNLVRMLKIVAMGSREAGGNAQ